MSSGSGLKPIWAVYGQPQAATAAGSSQNRQPLAPQNVQKITQPVPSDPYSYGATPPQGGGEAVWSYLDLNDEKQGILQGLGLAPDLSQQITSPPQPQAGPYQSHNGGVPQYGPSSAAAGGRNVATVASQHQFSRPAEQHGHAAASRTQPQSVCAVNATMEARTFPAQNAVPNFAQMPVAAGQNADPVNQNAAHNPLMNYFNPQQDYMPSSYTAASQPPRNVPDDDQAQISVDTASEAHGGVQGPGRHVEAATEPQRAAPPVHRSQTPPPASSHHQEVDLVGSLPPPLDVGQLPSPTQQAPPTDTHPSHFEDRDTRAGTHTQRVSPPDVIPTVSVAPLDTAEIVQPGAVPENPVVEQQQQLHVETDGSENEFDGGDWSQWGAAAERGHQIQHDEMEADFARQHEVDDQWEQEGGAEVDLELQQQDDVVGLEAPVAAQVEPSEQPQNVAQFVAQQPIEQVEPVSQQTQSDTYPASGHRQDGQSQVDCVAAQVTVHDDHVQQHRQSHDNQIAQEVQPAPAAAQTAPALQPAAKPPTQVPASPPPVNHPPNPPPSQASGTVPRPIFKHSDPPPQALGTAPKPAFKQPDPPPQQRHTRESSIASSVTVEAYVPPVQSRAEGANWGNMLVGDADRGGKDARGRAKKEQDSRGRTVRDRYRRVREQ